MNRVEKSTLLYAFRKAKQRVQEINEKYPANEALIRETLHNALIWETVCIDLGFSKEVKAITKEFDKHR